MKFSILFPSFPNYILLDKIVSSAVKKTVNVRNNSAVSYNWNCWLNKEARDLAKSWTFQTQSENRVHTATSGPTTKNPRQWCHGKKWQNEKMTKSGQKLLKNWINCKGKEFLGQLDISFCHVITALQKMYFLLTNVRPSIHTTTTTAKMCAAFRLHQRTNVTTHIMLKKSCFWKILTVYIFSVRMYQHTKQFMIQATLECECDLGIHSAIVTVIATAN